MGENTYSVILSHAQLLKVLRAIIKTSNELLPRNTNPNAKGTNHVHPQLATKATLYIRQAGEFYDPLEYRLPMIDPKERIQELAEHISELKANWPAHSVQPWMLQQLEELEEELEALKKELTDE